MCPEVDALIDKYLVVESDSGAVLTRVPEDALDRLGVSARTRRLLREVGFPFGGAFYVGRFDDASVAFSELRTAGGATLRRFASNSGVVWAIDEAANGAVVAVRGATIGRECASLEVFPLVTALIWKFTRDAEVAIGQLDEEVGRAVLGEIRAVLAEWEPGGLPFESAPRSEVEYLLGRVRDFDEL